MLMRSQCLYTTFFSDFRSISVYWIVLVFPALIVVHFCIFQLQSHLLERLSATMPQNDSHNLKSAKTCSSLITLVPELQNCLFSFPPAFQLRSKTVIATIVPVMLPCNDNKRLHRLSSASASLHRSKYVNFSNSLSPGHLALSLALWVSLLFNRFHGNNTDSLQNCVSFVSPECL